MMKCLAVLSFIIALLSVPIEAQAQQQEQVFAAQRDQALRNIQETKYQYTRALAYGLRADLNAEQLLAAERAQQWTALQYQQSLAQYQQLVIAQQELLAAQRAQQRAAQIQAQAQQYPVTNCVRFPQNADPEAEVRYLISHPTPVCPSDNPDLAGQARTVQDGLRQGATNTSDVLNAMSGH